MADQFLLPVQIKVPGRGAAGDDEGPGFQPRAVHFDAGVGAGMLEFLDHAVLKARPEFFRLLVHPNDEVGSVHTLGEAGEIFHSGGGGELTAGLAAFQNERSEVGPGGVDGGGETGATRSDNNHIFHRFWQ